MECDYCQQEIEGSEYSYETGGYKKIKTQTFALPFTCKRCYGKFCTKHRLPETHNCTPKPKPRPKPITKTASMQEINKQVKADMTPNRQYRQLKPIKYNTNNDNKLPFLCWIGIHRFGKKKFDGYIPRTREYKYVKTCKGCGMEKRSYKKA